MLFRSQHFPGVVMNRHGVVLRGARPLDREERAVVLREAIAAGWTLQPSDEPDLSRLWQPPTASPAPRLAESTEPTGEHAGAS